MTLALEDVSLTLGAFSLCDIAFRVADGEILAILGPNGAGKSVTLEVIAGFHRPESGRVVIGERDVTAFPPERRAIGLVPQSYGLFPHLNVAKNVAVGLRNSQGNASARAAKVARLLERFGIARLARRMPRDLSPGERQRTALARALAMRPQVFLFDEPFAALDSRLRETLREELAEFLREAKVPAVFVTHDQTDVTALADRVAVMRAGEIVQEGPVEDVFRAPVNRFVAEFVGVENQLSARVLSCNGKSWHVALGEHVFAVPPGPPSLRDSREVSLCIRGEDVTLHLATGDDAKPSPQNHLVMRIVRVIGLGALCKVTLDAGFSLTAYLTARELRELGLTAGAEALVEIEPAAIHVLAPS